MPNVPLDTRFIGIAPQVNLTESKSALINAETQPYTMQDIVDTAGGGGGYLKYVALLNQSGVLAPVATVLENTLGGTPVWTRSGVGNYVCTLNGAFTPNKTFCMAMIGPVWGQGTLQFSFGINTINECELSCYLLNGSANDSGNDPGNDICVEIRVYP